MVERPLRVQEVKGSNPPETESFKKNFKNGTQCDTQCDTPHIMSLS